MILNIILLTNNIGTVCPRPISIELKGVYFLKTHLKKSEKTFGLLFSTTTSGNSI